MKKFIVAGFVAVVAITGAATTACASQEPVHNPQATFVADFAEYQEQPSTSDRIHEFFPWIGAIMDNWADELGMTIDEIFDNVREASRFEYIFENDIELSHLADVVGLSSSDFASLVQQAYVATRSIDVVNRWASELDMTVDELYEAFEQDEIEMPWEEFMAAVFRGEPVFSPLSESLGVDWYQFQFVLSSVSTAHVARNFSVDRNEYGISRDSNLDDSLEVFILNAY
ncbi:MAG: hypothetical protein FWC89_03575 [Defluviitaleaceae bacterium]|nr:hypothetical protein [Defluviitaleaceae bacterium]